MDNDSEKKIKSMLREMMDADTLKKSQDEMEEKYAKLLEQNTELKAAEEARIAAPAKKVSLEVPGSDKKVDFMYKGYNLKRQAMDITLADEETKSVVSKFVIDMIERKALTEGSTTGQIMVPDEFEDSIMGLARLTSVALGECRVFNISRDVLKIPVEATGQSVDVQAFGTANVESTPTLTEITLDMKRIGNYGVVHDDLLEDSVFDIVSWITSLNAEAVGQKIDAGVFTGGTFTSDLYDCTTNVITVSGTNGTIADISYAHFSEAIAGVTDNKLTGAKFYMNRALTHYVRTEKDSQNRPIWIPPTATTPGAVYGFPMKTVEALTAAPTSGGAFMIFGNLKHYALGIRKGMKMEVNPWLYRKEGMTELICHTRLDGAMMIEPAFTIFKLA